MKHGIPVLAAAVASLLALVPGPALAIGTLDQQQTNTSGYTINWIPGVKLAQTFTAARTGKLDTIDINADGYGSPVTIEIEAATSVPTGAVLDTQSLSLNDTGWTQIKVKTPPSVTAGSKYAILISQFTNVGWHGDCSNAYGGGQAFVFDTSAWYSVPGWAAAFGASASSYCALDYAFRTYVTKPAPAATPKPATPAPTAAPVATVAASAGTSAGESPSSEVLGATAVASTGSGAGSGSPTSNSGGSGDSLVPILIGVIAVLCILLVGVLGYVLGRQRQPKV